MPDLKDGETCEMQGSGKKPYVLKNTGGVYSCSCPSWRNQSLAIDKRTCKHLRKLRGDIAEEARIGTLSPVKEEKVAKPAPPLLLANVWDGILDPTGWWVSEKLDGVRALWCGKTREFISRLGNTFHAPDWFIAGLPDQDLDGELWMGRKMFQRCVGIVKRQDKSDEWKKIRFFVFDAPSVPGSFEERISVIAKLIDPKNPYAQVHEHVKCCGTMNVKNILSRVIAEGGEGLMLRQPQSLYEANRSMTLLKVKSFLDEEAVVIGHEPGKGKHKGRLGALRVKSLANNKEFSVGTGFSDAERKNPPSLGAIITFKYQELTDDGIPRFPSYLCLKDS